MKTNSRTFDILHRRAFLRATSLILLLTQVSCGPAPDSTSQTSTSSPSPTPVFSSTTPVGNRINPRISVVIDHPIVKLDPKPGATQVIATVQTYDFPADSQLSFEWRQVQEQLCQTAARMDQGKKLIFTGTNGSPDTASVKLSFPDWGVYEIRVTVTDQKHGTHYSRNAWVNVWDYRSHIIVDGKPDPLAVAPGILPPPSVTQFNPDPGPFAHPRLLCTPDDWPDINARCLTRPNKDAGSAYKQVASTEFDAKKGEKSLADALDAFDASGFAGPEPDLLPGTTDPKQAINQVMDFHTSLLNQAFAQWVKIDPRLPWAKIPDADQAICRRLARIHAAYCRVYLDKMWTPGLNAGEPGTFHADFPAYLTNLEKPSVGIEQNGIIRNIALSYDFLAPWMTEQEQRTSRSFLVAVGMGRLTNPHEHHNAADPFHVNRGFSQNDTWSNFGDDQIPAALVVAGEESEADPRVMRTFVTAPPVDPSLSDSDPYSEAVTWPHARKSDVGNLVRQIYILGDMAITPWGTMAEREAYFAFYSGYTFPTSIMSTRQGGENLFVTTPVYPLINHLLDTMYPCGPEQQSKLFGITSSYAIIEHHSGGGDYRDAHTTLLKYLFPDDPAVDFWFATRAGKQESSRNSIIKCIFGLDPTTKSLTEALPAVAKAKDLPLTRLDPQQGEVVMRSDWSDEAMHLDMEANGLVGQHQCQEANSFALYALGRSWVRPPGYHKDFSNWHAGIHVQYEPWASDPTTQGYIGTNPCFPPQIPACDMPLNYPPMLAKLILAKEAPDQTWSIAVGDATAAYNFLRGGPQEQRIRLRAADSLYPGLLEDLGTRVPAYKQALDDKRLDCLPSPAGKVQWAIRSVLMVRGKRPYALIIDDFRKDDSPHNYRWMINNTLRTKPDWSGALAQGDFSMHLAPGATSTEGTLFHLADAGDAPGLPRLLVRDLSEANNVNQPVMRMDQTEFKQPKGIIDHYLDEQPNRLLIERDHVIEPQYKVLLFPFRTGEKLPLTRWNDSKTELTIDSRDGTVDIIHFTSIKGNPQTQVTVTRSVGK